ncbi:molybdenum cofactor biosynthesis protein B [Chromobacterium subtsugae]|uniref:molybdenum cofactor biosynthesis protein B n=1 Tax=Chromobacterium subtsugae TaxID=251747 RepID=UPI0007F90A8F|nr:molybdenum cofactor biosynthesis protein B [Chromobacterium subtsugae]OBU87428.1 molybdopterin biosynthesis protein B [Chromobacterium subtsugae]
MHDEQAVSLRCAVLTISDRRTLDNDGAGDLLAEKLSQDGHVCARRGIVADNIYQIRRVLSEWIAEDEVQVILTSGGTGFSPRNSAPEAVLPLLDKEIDGFGELYRHFSLAQVGSSALQSRALAGFANRTLIFCLPGAERACELAWDKILREQLDSRHQPCNFASAFRVKEES